MRAPYVQQRGEGCDRKCPLLYCTYVHYTRKNRRGQGQLSRCTTRSRFRRRRPLQFCGTPSQPSPAKGEDCGTRRRTGVPPTLCWRASPLSWRFGRQRWLALGCLAYLVMRGPPPKLDAVDLQIENCCRERHTT